MDSDELRELRRIERWLAVNDPDLAEALSAPGAVHRRANRPVVRLAIHLFGTASLLIGAITDMLWIVFAGVLVLMVGACLHTTRRHRTKRV
ncbi:Protein of unknown function [Lentzea xinjiangensis]|uniref:DUF3040 domain-containing protein n=1 Tax=Lentzea xinjiangensis TaxID=402600 RepID=A0A1H9RHB8_9PSEU|nr:DUF3040 domain-containing protein [Lentzea xinjiangensis]SER72102.1 Protein of unknown function [Lentzea xinjiangensis]